MSNELAGLMAGFCIVTLVMTFWILGISGDVRRLQEEVKEIKRAQKGEPE